MTHAETACLVASLLAIDPAGLGGVRLRGGADARRDGWLALFRGLLPRAAPWRRVPAAVSDRALFGGLDLTSTLRRGRSTLQRGVLAGVHDGVLLIAMAERLETATAARINAAIDAQRLLASDAAAAQPLHFGVVALDEGIDDEAAPASLLDRLAFDLDLRALDPRESLACEAGGRRRAQARTRYLRLSTDAQTSQAICESAVALGVESLRVQLLATRVARAAAALRGAERIDETDLALAVTLVLVPRATRVPAAEDTTEPAPPENPPPEPAPSQDSPPSAEPPQNAETADERTVAAALAHLPADVLARVALQRAGGPRRGQLGRSGVKIASKRRGRPAGVRAHAGGPGARLDVVATLQAAAPWQTLRRRRRAGPLRVLPADFRFTRFKQQSRTLVVFAVDASGSSALHRLAEAKGAVELILGECYVRRDEVAVIGFRQRAAQLLLPPTRSLVRARHQLAGLPGGGGTPIASGLRAAHEVALAARRRGDTPLLVVLTDGHANVDLAGAPGREGARRDALQMAQRIAESGVAALLIDTAPRPQPLAQALAGALCAQYIPLPSSDSAAIAASLRTPMRRHRAGK